MGDSSSNTRPNPAINFKTYKSVSSNYRFNKVYLDNIGNSQITLDPVSSQTLQFKLPAKVYNLSKSFLTYNINFASAGASGANYAFADVGLEMAQSITFGNSAGMNVVDVNHVNNYLSVARKIDTSIDDFESSDITEGMSKAVTKTSNWFPPTFNAPAGNIYGLAAGVSLVGATENEPRYVQSNSALNTNLVVSRNFPLGAISGTLFAMDRDLYFADNMYLRIQTAPSSKVAYTSTSVTDPSAGAAALATQPTLTNITLYLAMEEDQLIIDSIQEKFRQGKLEFTIPFTYNVATFSSVGSVLATTSVSLTSQFGKLLKRMLYFLMPSQEILNIAYDHENFNASKVTSYQTALDSVNLQDGFLSCVQPSTANPTAILDDFRENRKYLKDSAIQNSAAYQLNWFHVDSWSDKSSDPNVPDSNVMEGVDLSIPRTYQVRANTTNANYTHYIFGLFQRVIGITPTGPVWLA